MNAVKGLKKMSKFVIENVGSGSTAGVRCGHLEIGENSFRLPGFFIHTLAGSVPHLTSEVFEMVFTPGSHPLQASIDSTFPFHENIKPSGMTISQFVGLPKSQFFLSVHNPLVTLSPGFNTKFGISIWTRKGRQTLPISKFIEIVNNFQPALFQVLSDYDVTSSSSVKRIRKSTSRTIEYLNEVVLKTETKAGAFATIEIAWFQVSPRDAELALTQILEKQNHYTGFVINGLRATDDKSGVIDSSILSSIIAKLPTDKPRYVPGEFTFWEIMDLVQAGIDLFDSSMVTRAAEDGHVFSLHLAPFLKSDEHLNNESLPSKTEAIVIEPLSSKVITENEEFDINLKDKRYFDDFSPISKTCDCYTCRKFTKAYLHHLLSTSELLGPVLLMMHNLTEFERFFQSLQYASIDQKRFSGLYDHLRNSSKIPLCTDSAHAETG